MPRLITESEVLKIFQSGKKTIEFSGKIIVTPLASDKLKELCMKLAEVSPVENQIRNEKKQKNNLIAIASDHTGFQLKSYIKNYLEMKGLSVIDLGPDNDASCDYPDFAMKIGYEVISGNVDFGVMIDATGVPSAITANKIPGIRAATCYNEFTAWSARAHNDANIIVLGAKAIGELTAQSIMDKWLATDFEGGRHEKRLNKIKLLEEKLLIRKEK